MLGRLGSRIGCRGWGAWLMLVSLEPLDGERMMFGRAAEELTSFR